MDSEHISDQECDEIFRDMDIEHQGKIHWHEFIAATLAKCEVDDRNMKLAFEKLDHHHHGFLTVGDLKDILGKDKTEEEVTAMFSEVDPDNTGKITYSQFVKIMKGPAPSEKDDDRRTYANLNDPDESESRRRSESDSTKAGGNDKHQERQDNMMKVQTHTEKLRLEKEKVTANPVRRNSAVAIPMMVAPTASTAPTLEGTKEE